MEKFKFTEDKKFREIHYPRDPGKWAAEKDEIRERAYYLAHRFGPDMATIFHIKRAKTDLAICGMIITDSDADYTDYCHSWTDTTGRLHVPCASCYNTRTAMESPTAKPAPGVMPFDDAYEVELEAAEARALARDLEPRDENYPAFTENEVRTAMEFWGEFPTMEKLEEEETGGLDITFPIR